MSAAPPQPSTVEVSAPPAAATRAAAGSRRARAEFPARDHRRGQPDRQVRRSRRHAVSARAQRLPALRPREVDHPQLRPRRGERRTLPPALRRHQPAQGGRRVRGLDRRVRALARATTGASIAITRPTTTTRSTAFAEWFIEQGLAYVDSQSAGGDARAARHADRGGPREPVPRPPRRRESRPLPPDARGRVSRRRARAAPQDRHGEPERQHARPGDLPDPPRVAPPHRRQVVHLPALRLHALHLATRSSGSRTRSARSSSRTTGRCTTGCIEKLADGGQLDAAAAAAVRVRAAQPHLRRAVEAAADRARRRRATSTAGTIRGCRRSSARGAADSRRRASGSSPSASACRSPTRGST